MTLDLFLKIVFRIDRIKVHVQTHSKKFAFSIYVANFVLTDTNNHVIVVGIPLQNSLNNLFV